MAALLRLSVMLLLVGTLLWGNRPFAAHAGVWVGTTGSFLENSNWEEGFFPISPEPAVINNGGTAQLMESEFADAGELILGQADGDSGTFEQAGGTMELGSAIIGSAGTGTAIISGDAEFSAMGGAGGDDDIFIGWLPGGVGEMSIDGAGTIVTSADDFQLGREGTGTLNFAAGTLRAGYTVVGKFGTGIWNQTGGLFDQDFGDLEIADGGTQDEAGTPGPRVGTVNLSGGIMQTAGAVAIGNRSGSGTFNVSGGAVAATGSANSSIYVGRGMNWSEDSGLGGPVEMRIAGGDAIIVANGDFVMNASGVASSSTLVAELTGPEHPVIRVAGNADIANGQLKVELDGFTPTAGDSWVLIEAGADLSADIAAIDDLVASDGYEPLVHEAPAATGAIQGEFLSMDTLLAPLSGGLSWDLAYTQSQVVLSVIGSEVLRGDYNGNGQVEQGDLDLVLLNWGTDAATPPGGWTDDLPSGQIDQEELDGVLLNWGASSGASLAVAAVPEPHTLALAVVAATLIGAVRLRKWRKQVVSV